MPRQARTEGMGDDMIELWIMRVLIGLLIAVGFYMLKIRDRKVEKLEDDIAKNRHDITRICGKLWSEDKLRKIIRESIKNAFNEFKVLLFEEGVLKSKDKK